MGKKGESKLEISFLNPHSAGIYSGTRYGSVNVEKKKRPPTGALRAEGGIRPNHFLAVWEASRENSICQKAWRDGAI